ncbi:MAG: hypothetical protein A2Y07_02260 [Planctomycetes bacterium GWF2_50_10]|nr:MAG: hypothetical protein A2Y07_02260 [Planctomycetes bacterium GWF2_50_10]
MGRSLVSVCLGLTLLTVAFYNGCSKGDYLDPTQIGRFRPVPSVNVILESLGVAEESSPTFAGAEDPKPVDSIALDEDYVFESGDVVRVSIYELQQEGAQYVNDFVVTETGKVSIPEVGQVQAQGLTEAQLEDEIKQILSPAILKEPLVTVLLQNSASRMFTILGDGVPNPGRYPIPRSDFRLAEALAVAGSPRQFNVSYIYISRRLTGKETQNEVLPGMAPQVSPDQQEMPRGTEDEMLDIIAPSAKAKSNGVVITAADVSTGGASVNSPDSIDNDLEQMVENPAGLTGVASQKQQEQTTGPVEWVFEDGRWKPVAPGQGAAPTQPSQLPQQFRPQTQPQVQPTQPEPQQVPAEYGWEQMGTAGVQKRVIRIPVKEFLGGDPRYNVMVKPGDVISVPVDIVGEIYVLGNTNNQGVLNVTGRPMTLMQAVATAGGLGPLAWPERVEVRRRIAEKKEETVLVNLKKIADGSQPDFFVKPNDTINIGTHPSARWLAVLRNAFRATYGFGFIYDRNFADRDFGGSLF